MFIRFRAHLDVLKSNGVGMDDPLVDSEDYPRNDIDVYQVNFGLRYLIHCITEICKEKFSY